MPCVAPFVGRSHALAKAIAETKDFAGVTGRITLRL